MATLERRRVRQLLLLALAALTLGACGVLPYTGPPEDNFYERGDHGHP